MEIITTPIQGLKVIQPKVFNDNRGFFLETYNAERYREAGITENFIQDNLSKSSYGVIRGLHYQLAPYSQTKLVQVIEGCVLDVAVDLRSSSPTFGQWYSVELSAENHRQFLIPRGFAHGFSVLSPTAIFAYKCDNLYNPATEGGIRFDDPALGIDWKIPTNKRVISDKDLKHPLLSDALLNF